MNSAEIFTILGTFVVLYLVLIIIALILAIFMAVVRCIIINKAEPGSWWKGIIPFYNRWVTLDLSFNRKTTILIFVLELVITFGSSGINFITRMSQNIAQNGASQSGSVAGVFFAISGLASLISLLVSLAVTAIKAYANYALCHAYGRETYFCVLAIFFPIIMLAILAFNPNIEYTEEKLTLLQD